MSVMKAVYTQLQEWNITPETATDAQIDAAYVATIDYAAGLQMLEVTL